jgi:hypothetical protein
MSQSRPERARRRKQLIGLLAAVAMGVVTLAVAPVAEAGKPVPTPAAVIRIDSVFTPSVTVPATDGSTGLSYIVKAVPFTVHFTTDGVALSATRSTTVVLTASGPDAGPLSLPVDVPAGDTEGEFTSAVLPTATNNVTLKVAVDARKTDVTPGTLHVDVLKNFLPLAQGDVTSLTGIGGGGGSDAPCSPTPEDQVCGDIILPDLSGVTSGLLLSQGSCDGLNALCGSTGSFLQALVQLNPSKYNRAHPIVLIAKCDKSLCAGKGIKSYTFGVQLTPTEGGVTAGSWTTSPACTSKGVIDPDAPLDFCTDYRQSTRDNAGDLFLYVLFAKDLKGIFR